MPAALLDPAVAYLRKQCGLPMRPATMTPRTDPNPQVGPQSDRIIEHINDPGDRCERPRGMAD
jgi:hypothetical protein